MTEDITKERHKELSGTRSNPGEAVANLPQPAKVAKRSSEEVAKVVGVGERYVREKGFNSIPEYLKHHDNDSQ